LEIDHVLVAVDDLEHAAAEMEARHGLTSVAGGRHTGWGTANRIVPLGDQFIELVAVVDSSAAALSTFGRWVAGSVSGRPMGWAVRTDDIDAVARRLAIAVTPGSRATPDGGIRSWRSAGMDVAAEEPSLPFFLQWADGTDLPGRTPIARPIAHARLSRLVLDGAPARLTVWLGHHDLPIEVRAGGAPVVRVVIDHDGGEIRL
jgi:hypothetical protein